MSRLRQHIATLLLLTLIIAAGAMTASAQRKITPVNNAHTATQPINEFGNDTARINARIRATMRKDTIDGKIVYIDTITGKEWVDSAAIKFAQKLPMQYPLLHALSIGVDIWNPLMRAFGQHYGLIDFSAQLSLHNRYKPIFEAGIGIADNTPADNNFTYKSPMSCYFRIGMDYNFLYNSTPDYQYFVGLRYGFSNFSYSIDDITITSTYWDETAHPTIPRQRSSVGWWEFATGLRVQLWGPISAGWTFRYHKIAHETKNRYGQPWYIPGYGSRGTSISGSVTIWYTFDLNKKDSSAFKTKGIKAELQEPEHHELYFPTPTTDNPYQEGIDDASSMQQQAQPQGAEGGDQ